MAGFFAVYHGPEGLRAIAERVHRYTRVLEQGLRTLGLAPKHACFFDTLTVRLTDAARASMETAATAAGLYFRYVGNTVGISLDETTTEADVRAVLTVAAAAVGRPAPTVVAHSESAPTIILSALTNFYFHCFSRTK